MLPCHSLSVATLVHPLQTFHSSAGVAKSVDRLPMDGNVCPFESTFANRSDVLDSKCISTNITAFYYFARLAYLDVFAYVCVYVRK